MEVRKLTSNNKTYYGNLVYSADDDGYYVEIWQSDWHGQIQTDVHSESKDAWNEAKSIVLTESQS